VQFRESQAGVLPTEEVARLDRESSEVIVDVSLLAGQPAIEKHLASDVADGAGRPAANTDVGEPAKRVGAAGDEGGCPMECFVGSVVQIDPTLNIGVANLDEWDPDHGFEVRQHASK
jgi:hypothetical protein